MQRGPPLGALVQQSPGKRSIGDADAVARLGGVLDRIHTGLEDLSRIACRCVRHRTVRHPDLAFVGLLDGRDVGLGHSKETRCELSGGRRVVLVDDGGRGCDTDGVAGVSPAVGAEAADEAGGLGALCPGEGMGFVEDEEVEARVGKKLDVALPGEQQLELLDVGQQDARLPARSAHHLSGAGLLEGVDGVAATFCAYLGQLRLVVGPRGAGREPDPCNRVVLLGRLADVHAKRDACTGE